MQKGRAEEEGWWVFFAALTHRPPARRGKKGVLALGFV